MLELVGCCSVQRNGGEQTMVDSWSRVTTGSAASKRSLEQKVATQRSGSRQEGSR
jgi:hypothetical protein